MIFSGEKEDNLWLAVPALLMAANPTPDQIMVSCFSFAFICAALHMRSRTYDILAVSFLIFALLQIILFDLPAYSPWWPSIVTAVHLWVAVTIMAYGDKHIKRQIMCYAGLIPLHFFLAYDLWQMSLSTAYTPMVFEWVYPVIIGLIIAQLLGAGGGYILELLGGLARGCGRHKRAVHPVRSNKGHH